MASSMEQLRGKIDYLYVSWAHTKVKTSAKLDGKSIFYKYRILYKLSCQGSPKTD